MSSNRPSVRSMLALLLFWGLSYLESRLESSVMPALVAMFKQAHVDFQVIFGPKPAVPVNLLTVIVIFRTLYVLGATWLALVVAGKRWSEVGFSLRRAFRSCGAGMACGFIAISVLVGGMWLTGSLVFDGMRLQGAAILAYGGRWLIGMMLVGLEEEASQRGFGLWAISEWVGPIPAALITSIIFAYGHIGNPGETVVGIVQVLAFGLICAISVFRTGSIWWAVGFHAIWDWAQEFFYGTLGSGYWFDGHWLQFHPAGPEVLSGGTVGPEGSLYVFVVLAAVAGWLMRSTRRPAHRIDSSLNAP